MKEKGQAYCSPTAQAGVVGRSRDQTVRVVRHCVFGRPSKEPMMRADETDLGLDGSEIQIPEQAGELGLLNSVQSPPTRSTMNTGAMSGQQVPSGLTLGSSFPVQEKGSTWNYQGRNLDETRQRTNRRHCGSQSRRTPLHRSLGCRYPSRMDRSTAL